MGCCGFPWAGGGGTPANPSTSPTWMKFSFSHTDFQVPSLSTDIGIYSAPARVNLLGAVLKHSAQFAGVGITDYKLSVGLVGDLARYLSLFDVDTAPSTWRAISPFSTWIRPHPIPSPPVMRKCISGTSLSSAVPRRSALRPRRRARTWTSPRPGPGISGSSFRGWRPRESRFSRAWSSPDWNQCPGCFRSEVPHGGGIGCGGKCFL